MQQRFQSCAEFEEKLKGAEPKRENKMTYSIGRENCNINVPHQKVSRHHADIKVVGGGGQTRYIFEDHSSNGTLIDGRKVHNESVEIFPNQNPQILLAGEAFLNLDILHNSVQSK
jgi:pSer/pThr/pTyr-binding forkhead associated (FHA) protein